MFFKIFVTKFPIYRYQIRFKSKKSQLDFKLKNLLFEMPKEKKHIAEAQQQRIRIKERTSKYTPGTVTLQVLGSGAPGSPASVYLFTDQSRYLFNCGEGTQRLAHEHKTKLARLEHIFMTRTTWERFGGLPGLSLTVQDAGVPNLTLHGPPGLDEIFRAMRKFVVLRDLKVESVNCEEGASYEDQVMKVYYVPIEKNVGGASKSVEDENFSNEPEMDDTDYYAHEGNGASPKTPPSVPFQINIGKREESVVIAYICKLKPKQGTLLLEKCVDKGVPPGPLLGQLKNGFDVTLPNGTVVKAEDVTSPIDPGPVFIFLDIPSEEYLHSFKEKFDIFSKYQSTASNDSDAACVIAHFTSEDILNHSVYQEFIDNFPPSTKHLVLNSTNKFSGYVAAHRIQWQLNQMNEKVFPILKETVNGDNILNEHKRIKLSPKDDECADKISREGKNFETKFGTKNVNQNSECCVDHTNSLTCYHLRPKKGLDRTNEPILNPAEYIEETHAVDGFTESLSKLKTDLDSRYKELGGTSVENYPQIIFLGTGSCIPNKTRNVSAILLHTNRESSILLDCGEGTVGQLIRFYGEQEADKILQNLKAIYISHLHADHHIGLIGILKARQKIFGPELHPLLLLAPKQILSWLHFYDNRIEPVATGYSLISINDLIENPLQNTQITDMGIQSISTCLVRHCPYAFGVSIVLDDKQTSPNDPIKITYSGDTMPCDELVTLGKDSTILIHEATMEDELLYEAKIKMHSTVTQAIEQGNKMNAKYTILTHFSQRYAKIPRIENALKSNVGIAFDNMKVTVNDLSSLNLMYPTLKIMFSEHYEEMEQKAIKRALKKERNKQSPTENDIIR